MELELELNWKKNGIDPDPGMWQSRESTGMFGNLMAIYYMYLVDQNNPWNLQLKHNQR